MATLEFLCTHDIDFYLNDLSAWSKEHSTGALRVCPNPLFSF